MNSEEQIKITAMAFGGDGIGRLSDGRVVFVPFTTPGDEVIVEITQKKKAFCRGKVKRIVSPGKARISPVCPHFGSCGGCRWQHISYAEQVLLKHEMLVSELKKRTKRSDLERITSQLVPSQAFGYRSSARIQLYKGRIGFFQEKTHQLVYVGKCPVISERLQELINGLKQAFEPTKFNGFAEITEDLEGRTGIYLYSEKKIKTGLIERIKKYADVVVTGDKDNEIKKENMLNGGDFNYLPGVFVQKNHAINEKVKSHIEGVVKDIMVRDTFLELFAGAGNFTHLLSGLFRQGVAAELPSVTSELLSQNLAQTGVKVVAENIYKRPGPVISAVRDMLSRGTGPNKRLDLLIADPPRAGLKNWNRIIQEVLPKNIILISCDPPVFAYDTSQILNSDRYDAVSITPFDMFPQTAHFEVVGYFKLKKQG